MTAPPRRRRAFSLNGLAIQVSAFALSFTLVALLVVGSSRAAFVEPNETVTGRVPQPQSEPAPAPHGPVPPPAPTTAPRTPPTAPPTAPPPEPAVPTGEPVPEPLPAAEVDLTDDAAGTAMFTGGEDGPVLVPGSPEQRCIRVTLDGSGDPPPVHLYAASAEGALAPYLDLSIEIGGPDGGIFGDCTGFAPAAELFTGTLAQFGARHDGYDRGLATWDPVAGGESRSFRFTVTVRDDPAAEGLSAAFGFTWEARG